jgi:hypothetical protein
VEDNPSRGPLHIADPQDDIRIPLQMSGTNILFESRTPTQQELESCRKIQLSSKHERQPTTIHEKFHTIALVAAVKQRKQLQEEDEDEIYNPDTFSRRLIKSVKVSLPSPQQQIKAILSDTTIPPTFSSEDRRAEVTPQTLSDRWMVGLQQATLTLKNTTQRYIRSALLPLSRRQ